MPARSKMIDSFFLSHNEPGAACHTRFIRRAFAQAFFSAFEVEWFERRTSADEACSRGKSLD